MKTQILNFSDRVTALAYNGHLLAVGLDNGTIKIYEYQFGAYVLLREWEGHTHLVSSLVFITDGSLVSGSYDESVKRWVLETGRTGREEVSTPKELWVGNFNVGSIDALAELTGGRVALGCRDGTVRVLDLDTGLLPSQGGVCRGHTCWVSAVISRGVVGDRAGSFASGSLDETIRVWANDGTLTRVVEVGSLVRSLSFSPTSSPCGGGGMVAAGCYDGSVCFSHLPEWDLVWKNGSEKVHTDWVNSVSFSPDGRFLASASDDRLVKILSSETGAVLKTFKGHSDYVQEVIFSQDGLSVISGSDDKTVRVWRLVEQDDRIASLLSGHAPSELIYQGADVFKQLFTIIRTRLIG